MKRLDNNIQQAEDKLGIFIGIFIYAIVAIILVNETRAIDTSSANTWYTSFSVMCIAQLVLHLFYIRIYKIKLFSITGMFIIFTYLYHYGCTFTIGILNNRTFDFYYFFNAPKFDFLSYVGASEMSYIGIMSTFAGVMLFELFSNGRMVHRKTNLSDNDCFEMGKRILACTLPFKLYSDVTRFIVAFRRGYIESFDTGTSGYVGMIGLFAIAGVVLIIIAYHEVNRKKAMKIFVISVVYCVINMLTGARGKWLIIVFLLAYFAYKYNVLKVDKKRLILLGFVGFFGITFLNTLKDVRGNDEKTFSVYAEQFVVELTEYNPVITMVAELGNTIRTPYLCYEQMPSRTKFANGKTYFQSFFSIFPNITISLKQMNREAIFSKNLDDNHAIGGSFIAEAYYNFGDMFWIATIFIGCLVAWFSRRVEISIHNKQYLSLAFILPVLINILWLPRDSFYSLVRPAVYGYLLIGLFVRFTVKKDL